jgi:hypothetical protein
MLSLRCLYHVFDMLAYLGANQKHPPALPNLNQLGSAASALAHGAFVQTQSRRC